MIRNGGRYASLLLGAGALLWLANLGIEVIQNPFRSNEYLIEDRALEHPMWEQLLARKDVVFCLVWFFVTVGPTTTLPADFNTASNQIHVIGNGYGGFAGSAGGSSDPGGGGGDG